MWVRGKASGGRWRGGGVWWFCFFRNLCVWPRPFPGPHSCRVNHPRGAHFQSGPQKLGAAATGAGHPILGLRGYEAPAGAQREPLFSGAEPAGCKAQPVPLPEAGAGVWGVSSDMQTTPIPLGSLTNNPFDPKASDVPPFKSHFQEPQCFTRPISSRQPRSTSIPSWLGLAPSQSSGQN